MRDLFVGEGGRHGKAEIDDAVLTLSQGGAGEIEWPLSRRLNTLFWYVVFGVLLVLAGRFFYLNTLQGSYYQEVAENNSLRSLVIPAPRGIIFDRYGKALVENLPSIDALLVPTDLPKDDLERARVLETVRTILGLDETLWQERVSHLGSGASLPLKENLTQEEIILLINREKDLPGITLFKTARRHYLESTVFSHILGYEGIVKKADLVEHPDYLLTDSIGKEGVEKAYESSLRGVHGAEQVEVDSLGRVKRALGILPPKPGNDITLHVDAELQKKTHAALSAWLTEHELKRAAAIALDPRDGSVLSLVSLPSYDNNLFSEGIGMAAYKSLIEDPSEPLFNRAVSGAYPPGSTIKPIYASAALAENLIVPETTIESRGGINVGRFFFGDWKVHGFTDLRRAIAVSSDVYFYSIGGGYGNIPGLGIERMKRYANLFGFGERTGIDLPGEVPGFFPDPEWKQKRFNERWYIGDDYNSSIGQGYVLSTPLQIVNAIAAIANGGTLYKPHLLASTRSDDGKVVVKTPEVIRKSFIRPEILQVVREGMRETVTEGTAQSLKDLSIPVAGKTGTAQFGNEEKTHGWFVSFAPYDDPKIAMIILVEGQGEEGYNAVPLTKDILNWYFSRPE